MHLLAARTGTQAGRHHGHAAAVLGWCIEKGEQHFWCSAPYRIQQRFVTSHHARLWIGACIYYSSPAASSLGHRRLIQIISRIALHNYLAPAKGTQPMQTTETAQLFFCLLPCFPFESRSTWNLRGFHTICALFVLENVYSMRYVIPFESLQLIIG